MIHVDLVLDWCTQLTSGFIPPQPLPDMELAGNGGLGGARGSRWGGSGGSSSLGHGGDAQGGASSSSSSSSSSPSSSSSSMGATQRTQTAIHGTVGHLLWIQGPRADQVVAVSVFEESQTEVSHQTLIGKRGMVDLIFTFARTWSAPQHY
jgi:hypothetical protein